jgi:hypothetical protein
MLIIVFGFLSIFSTIHLATSSNWVSMFIAIDIDTATIDNNDSGPKYVEGLCLIPILAISLAILLRVFPSL